MGQHGNAEHDQSMEHAAKHSTYQSHDGKANAPMPFNAKSPVGQPDIEEEGGTDKQGEKDAPRPFNAQKGKPIMVKGKGLSQGKTG